MYLSFRSGRSYTLHGVPEYHYYGLLNSSSPGRYFNAFLKGRYQHDWQRQNSSAAVVDP
jgi:hypothetical protein